MAVVDSGADFCVFPYDFADQLGMNLDHAERIVIYGISGVEHEARLAQVKLGIVDPNTGDRAFEVPVNCAFCFNYKFGDKDSRDGGGTPLLGQSGFFNHFTITFRKSIHRFHLGIPKGFTSEVELT